MNCEFGQEQQTINDIFQMVCEIAPIWRILEDKTKGIAAERCSACGRKNKEKTIDLSPLYKGAVLTSKESVELLVQVQKAKAEKKAEKALKEQKSKVKKEHKLLAQTNPASTHFDPNHLTVAELQTVLTHRQVSFKLSRNKQHYLDLVQQHNTQILDEFSNQVLSPVIDPGSITPTISSQNNISPNKPSEPGFPPTIPRNFLYKRPNVSRVNPPSKNRKFECSITSSDSVSPIPQTQNDFKCPQTNSVLSKQLLERIRQTPRNTSPLTPAQIPYENDFVDSNTHCYNTYGDGNCLYRAVSIFMWGHEDGHALLRELTFAELSENASWYQNRCNRLLTPEWDELLANRSLGVYSSISHFFALCNALQIVGILYGRRTLSVGLVGTCFPFRTVSSCSNLQKSNVCAIAWYPLNSEMDNHFIFVQKLQHTFMRAYLREPFDSLVPYQILCNDMPIPQEHLEVQPSNMPENKDDPIVLDV